MAYRSIDGSNVDTRNPFENAAGTDVIRLRHTLSVITACALPISTRA